MKYRLFTLCENDVVGLGWVSSSGDMGCAGNPDQVGRSRKRAGAVLEQKVQEEGRRK